MSERSFAILGTFAALACLCSGCGTSGTSPVLDASVPRHDAEIVLVTVMTEGGGELDDGAVVDPFAGSSSSSSGGPQDATVDVTPTPDDSSSAGDGTESDSGACESYTPPICGTTPCDLRSNTCCITFVLQNPPPARCVPGASATCNSNEITAHCLQACECGGGYCCGQYDKIHGVVQSVCESESELVAFDGGLNCYPSPETVSSAAAQLCKTDAECQNGQPCISQTCVAGANLSVCGLQSQSPYDCVANESD